MTGDRHKSNIKVSQAINKKYNNIIGFDLGSSVLSCSYISDKYDPHSTPVIITWGDNGIERYPACIFYKDWPYKEKAVIKYGPKVAKYLAKIESDDVHIPDIKAHVFKLLKQGESPNNNAPTKEKIMSDFWTRIKKLIDMYLSSRQDQRKTIESCRFVFSIPDGSDQSEKYMDLIHSSFVTAGLLGKNDHEDRLIFVTDAVAAGYACLLKSVGDLKLERKNNHLVCDIGYSLFKVAIINAELTDEMSVIKSLSKSIPGYSRTESLFEELIVKKRVYNEAEIQRAAQIFTKYDKAMIENDGNNNYFGGINVSNSDIIDHVFKPFTDSLFDLIYPECDKNEITKIVFCGKYSSDLYFVKQTEDFLKKRFIKAPSIQKWDDESGHNVSQGAAAFGLRVAESEIPIISKPPKDTSYKNADDDKKIEENLPEGSYVVGIDFGTTYSGCSYANISGKRNENTRIKTIELWDEGYEYPKIPTVLQFNLKTKDYMPTKWGYDAISKPPEQMCAILKNFKLLLVDEYSGGYYGKGNKQFQKYKDDISYTKLEAADIIAHYLRYFIEKVKKKITEDEREKKPLNLRYVITVPAMWNHVARTTIVNASITAGLVTSKQAHLLLLISEPEAAAIACHRFMESQFRDHVKNKRFIVCDAGGETVDLVTFQKNEQKDEKGIVRNVIEQIGHGNGGTCGAAYLDTNFRKHIENFYNRDLNLNITENDFFEHHMKYFRRVIKKDFDPRLTEPYIFELCNKPSIDPIAIEGRQNKHLINNCKEFKITVKEVQEIVFDPVVKQVCELLNQQIGITGGAEDLFGILMVGGFSESSYLQSKVKAHCSKQGIYVGIPPDGAVAISKGAVSYYLDPSLMIMKKVVRASFALQVQNSDPTRDCMLYFTQKKTCRASKTKKYDLFVSVKHPNSAVIAIFSRKKDEDNYGRQDLEFIDSNKANDFDKLAEYRFPLPENLKINTKTLLKVSLMIDLDAVTVHVDILSENKNKSKNTQEKDSMTLFSQVIETPAIQFKRRIPANVPSPIQVSLKKLEDIGGFIPVHYLKLKKDGH